MEKEQVREYLIDLQSRKLPELKQRDLKIDESTKIKSIIGPRRAGKTFLIYQKIKELINSGTRKQDILYLSFEDPRLIDINFKDIREIIKLHWALYPEAKERLHIFMDEPQVIEKWATAVRSLHDEQFNIYLTGSSSKLLSKEIASSLRGRTLSYLLLPLSFKEFLKFKNRTFDINKLTSKSKAELLALLDEYLELGGYPEVVNESKTDVKLRIIKEYLDMVIYRDIIERYNIKNTSLIRWLIQSIISSSSKEFSVNKVFLTLKSRGVKVSKNTLYSYLSMLKDSMFAFLLPKFEYSIRKRDFSINKIYLCDTGFAKLIGATREEGKKIENIVYLQLMRNRGALTKISYWKDQSHEVDFVISEGLKVKRLIQVCSDLSDLDTKKREISGLLKASSSLNCKDLLVITKDKEGSETINGLKIKYTPVWKWILE